jgi:hypothetical protein
MTSILVYYVFFALATLIATAYSKQLKRRGKASILLAATFVLFTSIFAALRSLDVGTDLKVYGISTFSNSQLFSNPVTFIELYRGEPLYYLLNWITSHLVADIHFFLFAMQAISSTIILIVAKKYKDRASVVGIIGCYLLIWYCSGFNIMRQGLAIEIILLGIDKVIDKKYLHFLPYIIVASLFHASAIIALVFIPMKMLSQLKNNSLLLAALVGLTVLIESKINIVLKMLKMVSEKYEIYETLGEANIRYRYFLIILLTLALYLFFFSRQKTRERKNDQLFLISQIYNAVLYFSSAFIPFGYRASYYFLIISCISIPCLANNLKKRDRFFFNISITALMIIQWITRYVIIGYDGIIPFSFM